MEFTSVVGREERQRLIQQKAYEIYLSRGCSGGREVEDWLAAEKAVEAELSGGVRETREPRKEIGPRPIPRVLAPEPPKRQTSAVGGLGQRIKGKFRRASS